jgi:hypothetical protein
MAARHQLPENYPRSLSGEGGIRTRDTSCPVCRFSKPVPSATRPPLRPASRHAVRRSVSVSLFFCHRSRRRRRRDSNPRCLRTTVFKTAAFNHSATPPSCGGKTGLEYMDRVRLVKKILALSARCAVYAGEIRSKPVYGRNASGITTEPSACCPCSSTATSVRPIAKPLPLSVWTRRGFSPGAGR